MTEQPIAASAGAPATRYALIFRTHFWDGFAARQFARAAAAAPGADLWVLVDETRGRVEGIPGDRVFRLTDGEILQAGYPPAGEGSIQWYSGDVPLYMFRAAHPEYDLYLQMEYDVNFHLDLDAVAARIAAEGVDMVALTKGEDAADWPWLSTCLDVYTSDEVRHQLICIGAFSARALDVLARERLAQAARLAAGEIGQWPYCEGYLATEAVRQGLRTRELSDYGSVDAYDWWPPYAEHALPRLRRFPFVHPVLDERRFVPSLFKRPLILGTIISPRSWFGRKLRSLGPAGYLRALFTPSYRKAFRELSRARWESFRQDRRP